jgi:Leucine-rich repeat (LRR) protein
MSRTTDDGYLPAIRGAHPTATAGESWESYRRTPTPSSVPSKQGEEGGSSVSKNETRLPSAVRFPTSSASEASHDAALEHAPSAQKGARSGTDDRKTSMQMDMGATASSTRFFSWSPERVAAMLNDLGFPNLGRFAEAKNVSGADLLHARQLVGSDEAVGKLVGTDDAREQREVVAKIKEIRAAELASMPKVPPSILPKIELATRTPSLNMDNCKLTRLPDTCCEIVSLTSLSFCSNNLRSILPEIGLLTKLLSLKSTSNKLLTIPESLGYLKVMQVLLLDDNQIRALPDSLCGCTALRVLDVSQNDLSMLPTTIHICKRINKLNCYQNPLLLPEDLVKRGASPLLKILHALHVCGQTRHLDISSMQLKSIPAAVMTISNLTSLNMHNNTISKLDGLHTLTCLRSLTLTNNLITSIPLLMRSLTNLTSMTLTGNAIVSPPATILQLNADKIVRYLGCKSKLLGENIHDMFKAFDRDNSGSITRSEFSTGLHLIDMSHR